MTNALLSAEIKFYPILFDSAKNALRSVFLWITLLGMIAYLIAYFLLKEKPVWKKVKKGTLIGVIVYATIIFITQLIFSFREDGIVTILFVPLLVSILLIAGCVVLLIVRPGQISNVIAGSLIGAGLLAVLICIGVHFASGNAIEINGVDGSDVNSMMLYIFAAIGIALLFFISYFFGKKGNNGFDTKSITYAAICLALSFALSFLSLIKLPQGGSVTLVSLLPLMLYSQMFGVRKGVIVGFIYGLLQAIQTPYILHPAQFLLDYPIAFAMIGFASLFTQGGIKDETGIVLFAAGAIFAATMRYLAHFVSGVFAFSSYAPYAGYDSGVIYSLVYNSFVFVDMAIALVVGVMMLFNTAFRKLIDGINYSVMTPHAAETAGVEDKGE